MVRGGLRLVMAVLAAATFGAGCDGEDVEIDIRSTPTPGVLRTSTPVGPTVVRTSVATSTAGATVTATPHGDPTPTPTAGTGVNPAVQGAVDDLLPFFTIAGLTTGVSSSASNQQAAPGTRPGIGTSTQAKVDNCPDGGTRTQDTQLVTTVTLAACKFSDPDLGSFQFDGVITASLATSNVTFDVTTQDLINNRTVTFEGSVTGTPTDGGFDVDGGPIVITTPQGNFTLDLDHIMVDSTGNVVSGAGTATDDDDNFDLLSIKVTIRSGGLLADLLATFDDNTTATFVIDLKKGEITPTG